MPISEMTFVDMGQKSEAPTAESGQQTKDFVTSFGTTDDVPALDIRRHPEDS